MLVISKVNSWQALMESQQSSALHLSSTLHHTVPLLGARICFAGQGRRQPSGQCLSRQSLRTAVILLALFSTPAWSARRAFVGDLEPKATAGKGSGRRLLEDTNEYNIIDKVGFDVLEMVKQEYDPAIGCYGGYGVYGYYGYWYGAYGTYNDEPFVDYVFEPEGYTSIEVEEDDFLSRRMMISESQFTGEDDYSFGLKPYELDIVDASFDYEAVVTPTYTFTYQGEGFGRYYGYVPLYFGKYDGETYFDYESLNELLALQEAVANALAKETRDQAKEELEANIAAGKWSSKRPTEAAPPFF